MANLVVMVAFSSREGYILHRHPLRVSHGNGDVSHMDTTLHRRGRETSSSTVDGSLVPSQDGSVNFILRPHEISSHGDRHLTIHAHKDRALGC